MALSFLKGHKLISEPAKKVAAQKDPLSTAKRKIIEAATEQKGFVRLIQDGKDLSKTKGGRTRSTWFTQQPEGWATSIRYGQISLPLDEKGNKGVLVGPNVEDLPPFYDAVIESVRKGELDEIIETVRAERSASLTGKTGRKGAKQSKAA